MYITNSAIVPNTTPIPLAKYNLRSTSRSSDLFLHLQAIEFPYLLNPVVREILRQTAFQILFQTSSLVYFTEKPPANTISIIRGFEVTNVCRISGLIRSFRRRFRFVNDFQILCIVQFSSFGQYLWND